MARPPVRNSKPPLAFRWRAGLTAIGSSLAIRRCSQLPWVLDEIDALDESNLGRFVELMEEFAEETQFLVVTHRPDDEAADTSMGSPWATMGFLRLYQWH